MRNCASEIPDSGFASSMRPGMTVGGGAQTFTQRGGQVLSQLKPSTIIHSGNVPMNSIAAKTFLVCHGAWSAGWAWKKMHPLMQAAGHRLVTPTYTGLGERVHLADPSIDLETHIQDMLNVIKYEDLRDIVLLGHSYGGMVATGRCRPRPRSRRAIDLSRRLRAATMDSRCSISTSRDASRCRMLREGATAGAFRRSRRRRTRRRPTSNGSPRAASICRSNVLRPGSSCTAVS